MSIGDCGSEYIARLLRIVHPVIEDGEGEGILPFGRANSANLGQTMSVGTTESFSLLMDSTVGSVDDCALLCLASDRPGLAPSVISGFGTLLAPHEPSWIRASHELLTYPYWSMESHMIWRAYGRKSSS